MPATLPGLVLVTGGSGYIAGFCIAQLLQEGWRIRTTIRSLGKAEQVRASVGKIGAEPTAIEFVKADLDSDEGWDQAVASADYVLHVASPVPSVDPKNDDELVRPARDGALRVLKAARDAGVKRVVLTSSISAIIYGRGTRSTPFTESDWTDETNRADTSPDDRSKTIAERAAWAWHGVEGGALELVVINPSGVIGPVVSSDFSASLNVVKKLLDGSVPGLPGFGFSLVDVRDTARLHILAMTASSAAGQRFIGSGDFFRMKDIASILKQRLGEKARKVPTLVLPDILVRAFAIFDPVLRGRLYDLDKERRVSSDKARQTLGWTARPAAESILAAARSLQAEGITP
ncbi:MAG: aldehyde reductase [Verrucomicrobia bacterium]|nr:aldehyde reductase [Verrucomicrobiota bacterium]